jgi:hypothetical protein
MCQMTAAIFASQIEGAASLPINLRSYATTRDTAVKATRS